jgi:nucleotide-binding universal stress UspA family protein
MSETVVVGFDGGGGSRRALDQAIETVKGAGGKVVVVVVEYMPVAPDVPGEAPVDLTTTVRDPTPLMSPEPTEELQAVIDKAKERVDAAGVEADYVWGFGDPGRLIVDAARDHNATKIIIGADHHRLLGRLFGDDVEAEVRHEAGSEVVVVR